MCARGKWWEVKSRLTSSHPGLSKQGTKGRNSGIEGGLSWNVEALNTPILLYGVFIYVCVCVCVCMYIYKGKGEVHHEGPEGEQMYSFTLPSTSALDGGRWPLYPREITDTHFIGGWVGRSERMQKISPPPRFDPRTIQSVASRYTNWAIPAPLIYIYI